MAQRLPSGAFRLSVRKLLAGVVLYLAFFVAISWWFRAYFLGAEIAQLPVLLNAYGAFIAGLGTLGVVATLLLQQHQLDAQAKQIEQQNETIAHRDFEATLFRLLEVLSNIVDTLEVSQVGTVGPNVRGRRGFASTVHHLQEVYYLKAGAPKDSSTLHPSSLEQAYNEFAQQNRADFGSYFRMLLQILRFIDTSPVAYRPSAIQYLVAPMSNSEFQLLFYHCFSMEGKHTMKPLVEKYGILYHMRDSQLTTSLRSHVQPGAYQPYPAHDPRLQSG